MPAIIAILAAVVVITAALIAVAYFSPIWIPLLGVAEFLYQKQLRVIVTGITARPFSEGLLKLQQVREGQPLVAVKSGSRWRGKIRDPRIGAGVWAGIIAVAFGLAFLPLMTDLATEYVGQGQHLLIFALDVAVAIILVLCWASLHETKEVSEGVDHHLQPVADQLSRSLAEETAEAAVVAMKVSELRKQLMLPAPTNWLSSFTNELLRAGDDILSSLVLKRRVEPHLVSLTAELHHLREIHHSGTTLLQSHLQHALNLAAYGEFAKWQADRAVFKTALQNYERLRNSQYQDEVNIHD